MNIDKPKEILKIQALLKIPISDINFGAVSVEIFLNRIDIGGIPCHNIMDILHYETSPENVHWLKWEEVYNQNVEVIRHKISKLIIKEEFSIKLGVFRKLYVYDSKENFIASIICEYNNNEWSVFKG